MDTRTKIIQSAQEARRGAAWRCARGWFDVLTAEHCERLAAARPPDGNLLVLVHRETEARPTPLRAYDRAQMVAALACVEQVLVCDEAEASAIAAELGAMPVVDVESDQRRNVVRDVLHLHGGG